MPSDSSCGAVSARRQRRGEARVTCNFISLYGCLFHGILTQPWTEPVGLDQRTRPKRYAFRAISEGATRCKHDDLIAATARQSAQSRVLPADSHYASTPTEPASVPSGRIRHGPRTTPPKSWDSSEQTRRLPRPAPSFTQVTPLRSGVLTRCHTTGAVHLPRRE
jgi:hypothetical protein